MDDLFTPENFNILIYAVIIVGLILAARRLYEDFTRPLPDDEDIFDLSAELQQPTPSTQENDKKG